MIKDPASGKRISRPNLREEYQERQAEHLRIVDHEMWNASQERKTARRKAFANRTERGPTRLLSGLVRCGSCRGAMVSVGRDKGGFRLQCSAFRDRGTCKNGRRVKRDVVERLVLEALQTELTDPSYLEAFLTTYNAERTRLAKDSGRERARTERRVAEVERELNRAVDAIVKGGIDPKTLRPRIQELEAERTALAASLAAQSSAPPVALHRTAIDRYRHSVDTLHRILDGKGHDTASPEVVETLRALIEAVVVHAPPNSTELQVEIRGRLAELVQAPIFPHQVRGVLDGSGSGFHSISTPDIGDFSFVRVGQQG
jgi:site-specific DNA recombinase